MNGVNETRTNSSSRNVSPNTKYLIQIRMLVSGIIFLGTGVAGTELVIQEQWLKEYL